MGRHAGSGAASAHAEIIYGDPARRWRPHRHLDLAAQLLAGLLANPQVTAADAATRPKCQSLFRARLVVAAAEMAGELLDIVDDIYARVS